MIKPFNPLGGNKKQMLIKNKSEYELYEDDFNNYKSRSKSNLQQWNLLSGRMIPGSSLSKPVQSQVQHSEPSQNPLSLTPSKRSGLSVKNIKKSGNENKNKTETVGQESFSNKIKNQFQAIEIDKKSNEQISKEIKKMRQLFQQLNELVTTKLNKYELTIIQPKSMTVQNQPQKEQPMLKLQIQTNRKIQQSLQKQLSQIIDRDKQLQEKDYLIELEQLVNSAVENIKKSRKQKYQEGVIVEKKDNRLIQLRQLEEDDQYKMVKILKHNILFFFKKYNENVTRIELLNRKIHDLNDKDKQILAVYNKVVKIAEQKNMLVKANPTYIQNKKIHDEFTTKIQGMKKKIEVIKRSKQLQSQKIEKEIEMVKKQTASCDVRIEELSNNVTEFTKSTNQNIQKYQVSSKLLNKISYKFAQALIKDSNANTNYTGTLLLESEHERGYLGNRPKPKYNDNKSITISAENSVLLNARYSTIDNSGIQPNTDRKQKTNDKNMEFVENKSKQFRIKPSLNISSKKRSMENRSKLNDTSEVRDEILERDVKEGEIIYKPRGFEKILSQRKQMGV